MQTKLLFVIFAFLICINADSATVNLLQASHEAKLVKIFYQSAHSLRHWKNEVGISTLNKSFYTGGENLKSNISEALKSKSFVSPYLVPALNGVVKTLDELTQVNTVDHTKELIFQFRKRVLDQACEQLKELTVLAENATRISSDDMKYFISAFLGNEHSFSQISQDRIIAMDKILYKRQAEIATEIKAIEDKINESMAGKNAELKELTTQVEQLLKQKEVEAAALQQLQEKKNTLAGELQAIMAAVEKIKKFNTSGSIETAFEGEEAIVKFGKKDIVLKNFKDQMIGILESDLSLLQKMQVEEDGGLEDYFPNVKATFRILQSSIYSKGWTKYLQIKAIIAVVIDTNLQKKSVRSLPLTIFLDSGGNIVRINKDEEDSDVRMRKFVTEELASIITKMSAAEKEISGSGLQKRIQKACESALALPSSSATPELTE